MIWNPEYECMERAALQELQLRRLQMTTSWAYERSVYYRARMDEAGVRPRDVRSLDDVRRLPLTDESALRQTSPFGMFALRAVSITERKPGELTSPLAFFDSTAMRFESLPHTLLFAASVAPLRCFICDHLLCPDIRK